MPFVIVLLGLKEFCPETLGLDRLNDSLNIPDIRVTPPDRRLLRIEIDIGAANSWNPLNRLSHMPRAITALHATHSKLGGRGTSARAWRLAHGLDGLLSVHSTVLKVTEYQAESTRKEFRMLSGSVPTLPSPCPRPTAKKVGS
jgi:hypothetical protein